MFPTFRWFRCHHKSSTEGLEQRPSGLLGVLTLFAYTPLKFDMTKNETRSAFGKGHFEIGYYINRWFSDFRFHIRTLGCVKSTQRRPILVNEGFSSTPLFNAFLPVRDKSCGQITWWKTWHAMIPWFHVSTDEWSWRGVEEKILNKKLPVF